MCKRSILRTILYTLIVINVAFIWTMSIYSKEASGAQSGFVAELLRTLMPFLRKIPDDTFGFIVRKLAHFSEFAFLGLLSASALLERCDRKHEKIARLILPTLLLCLAVATTDETLQYFTNRGCSVRDMFIDFSGSVFGFALLCAVRALILRIKRQK